MKQKYVGNSALLYRPNIKKAKSINSFTMPNMAKARPSTTDGCSRVPKNTSSPRKQIFISKNDQLQNCHTNLVTIDSQQKPSGLGVSADEGNCFTMKARYNSVSHSRAQSTAVKEVPIPSETLPKQAKMNKARRLAKMSTVVIQGKSLSKFARKGQRDLNIHAHSNSIKEILSKSLVQKLSKIKQVNVPMPNNGNSTPISPYLYLFCF